MKDSSENVTNLWKLYRKGIDYQNSIGLRTQIPKFVKFFEGKQWPDATKNTKNLPRPVVNIVKLICRIKKAALLSTPVRLVYKSDSVTADVKAFNRFAEYIQKEMKLDQLDKDSVDDSVKKGSFFQHFYWDAQARGKRGKVSGALRGELIDPLNIFFENPCCLDEQKQGWIIIVSRENVDSVRAMADKSVNLEDIVADSRENNAYNAVEQDEDKLCSVITRYFRKDGKVYCEKATKSVVVNEPFSIIPNVEQAKKELGYIEDAPNNALPDNVEEIDKGEGEEYELYPIVAGYYEKREQCIYGLSEVEGLIPNQTAINFNIAMSLLNAQEMAWGKYIALPNALKGQKINNEPGQVLIDYSGTGHGIKKLTEQALHSTPAELSNTIIAMTRSVTGATEVMNGESIGSNMSGAAIAQLQAQAQTPIEELRDTFWLAKQKQGLVLAQFYKHFYYQKNYIYTEKVKDGEEQKADVFSSSKFKDLDFSVVVEATLGTRSSLASDISLLDACLRNGSISIETYIQAYPEQAIGNKSELIEILNAGKNNKEAQLSAQIQELQGQIAEYQKSFSAISETVNKVSSIISENTRLKEQNIELASGNIKLLKTLEQIRNEGEAKISKANEIMLRLHKDAQELAEGYLRNQGQGDNPPIDIEGEE